MGDAVSSSCVRPHRRREGARRWRGRRPVLAAWGESRGMGPAATRTARRSASGGGGGRACNSRRQGARLSATREARAGRTTGGAEWGGRPAAAGRTASTRQASTGRKEARLCGSSWRGVGGQWPRLGNAGPLSPIAVASARRYRLAIPNVGGLGSAARDNHPRRRSRRRDAGGRHGRLHRRLRRLRGASRRLLLDPAAVMALRRPGRNSVVGPMIRVPIHWWGLRSE
ncbi:unnamed protein product [Urochloa humidicola]